MPAQFAELIIKLVYRHALYASVSNTLPQDNVDNAILIAIISPILLTIGGLVTWILKTKREELLTQEEKSREFRIKTYETLLEPYIAIFTFTLPDQKKDKEIQKIASLEYKKAAFNLTTFGSDEVVKAFNKLMQSFYHKKAENYANKNDWGIMMLTVFSDFLLAIRRDLYTKNTKLKRSQLVFRCCWRNKGR